MVLAIGQEIGSDDDETINNAIMKTRNLIVVHVVTRHEKRRHSNSEENKKFACDQCGYKAHVNMMSKDMQKTDIRTKKKIRNLPLINVDIKAVLDRVSQDIKKE